MQLMSESVLCIFSSRSFSFQYHIKVFNSFRAYLCVKKKSIFIYFISSSPLSQAPFTEKIVFPTLHPFSSVRFSSVTALSLINWSHVYGLIFGFSILFHWSTFLFLCQYHTVLMHSFVVYSEVRGFPWWLKQ